MLHALKIKTKFLNEIIIGNKTFEVRKNDRNFKEGDFLGLNEIDPNGQYTGFCHVVKVTYILSDPEYVKDGYVILGIRNCEFPEKGSFTV